MEINFSVLAKRLSVSNVTYLVSSGTLNWSVFYLETICRLTIPKLFQNIIGSLVCLNDSVVSVCLRHILVVVIKSSWHVRSLAASCGLFTCYIMAHWDCSVYCYMGLGQPDWICCYHWDSWHLLLAVSKPWTWLVQQLYVCHLLTTVCHRCANAYAVSRFSLEERKSSDWQTEWWR